MSLESKLQYTQKLSCALCGCGQFFVYLNIVALIMMALRLLGFIEMLQAWDQDENPQNNYDWNAFNTTMPQYAFTVLQAEKDYLDTRGNRFYRLHTEKPTNLDNTIFLAESLLYIAQGILMLLVSRPVYTALRNRIHDEDILS